MIDKLQAHYGFTRMPFGRDLAPGMLHRHAAHNEACARITWCIAERASLTALGIDVFDPPLHGLVIAEAEFETDAELRGYHPPDYVIADVSKDPHFAGGRLARTSRADLVSRLTEYRVSVSPEQ